MSPDLGVFLPSTGGIADNSSTALTTGLIQAGIQGAAVGINARLQYGKPSGSTQTNEGGGGYMPYADRGGSPVNYTGVGSLNYIPTFQLGK
jgi:hypothetical protein